MKSWVKGLLCISLSLMCLFTCVGYASISTDLRIMGNVYSEPPTALFISDVSGGAYIDPDTLSYTNTIVNSRIVMQENDSGKMEARFSITVFNNTDVSYYYLAMVRGTYTTDSGELVAYSNENIVLTPDIQMGDEIKPGEMLTFNVTASFADNATDTSDPSLTSIIDYQFSTVKPENKDEAAVAGVLERFPEILNTAETYEYLISAMNTRPSNRVSTSYIGNVVEAHDQDSAAIEYLFGETMMLNIDGVNMPVTVMIKRENIDGNRNTGESPGWFGGREMTLYITADPLDVAGAYVPVYAAVYTKNSNSDTWYQLGDVFKGTAKVVTYAGRNGTGSFDTDTWRSTDNKQIEDLV